MKFTLMTLLTLFSLSTFAKTCFVAQPEDNPNDYSSNLATFTDVEKKDGNLIVLIKDNGEVVADFNVEEYYQGATTQEEVDNLTAMIKGSRIAMINTDSATNTLSLAIGRLNGDIEDMLNSSSAVTTDLSSSKAALFDSTTSLVIFCQDM